jgi:hypothetical protein
LPKTILSSRELNQDIGRAKKAAKFGPVIITDRGRPAFKATSSRKLSLFDALSMPEDDIELELPAREIHPGPIDLD